MVKAGQDILHTRLQKRKKEERVMNINNSSLHLYDRHFQYVLKLIFFFPLGFHQYQYYFFVNPQTSVFQSVHLWWQCSGGDDVPSCTFSPDTSTAFVVRPSQAQLCMSHSTIIHLCLVKIDFIGFNHRLCLYVYNIHDDKKNAKMFKH